MSDKKKYSTRNDPDFEGLSLLMHRAMNLAFAEGRLSWVRREEIRADILSAIVLDSYEVTVNGKTTICIYGEPSPAFMKEIGIKTFEPNHER